MTNNPYPGLRPFEYNENHLFFGREGQAKEISTRLEKNQFVAIVGTSGSGKSSLVKAGLIPLLYSGRMFKSNSHWRISSMRPGERPIHNLAEALVCSQESDFSLKSNNKNKKENKTQVGLVDTVLRRSGVGILDFVKTAKLEDKENLLIIVDQFEELFRFRQHMQVDYADEAEAFVKLLLEATAIPDNQVYVVITMRSDFFGNCAEFNGLPESINNGQYLVSQMNRNQLRESIEFPAKVFDAEVSPKLVNHLLNNLEENNENSYISSKRMLQDQLPILQHVLMRTWNEWKKQETPNKPISIEHYNKVGGMENALSIHADKVYGNLTKKQKYITEKLFKCLTETDEENREVRHPTTIKEICAIAKVKPIEIYPIIENFRQDGRTFLIPAVPHLLTEETTVDISHESLIRNWGRLKKWLREEAKDAWHYRRLSEDAYKWSCKKDKHKDFLLRGRVLKDLNEWWEKFIPNKAWAMRYQYVTDAEKLQLLNINSINDRINNHRELISLKYEEAIRFLSESEKHEMEEQKKENKLRQVKNKARYFKWLLGGTSLLLLFLIATAFFAYDTYNKRNVLEVEKQELSKKQKELKKENLSLYDEMREVQEAEKVSQRILRDFSAEPKFTSLNKTDFRDSPPCIENNKKKTKTMSVLDCVGVLGFKIEVITGNKNDKYTQTVNVINPYKKNFELKLNQLRLPKGTIRVGGAAQWWLKKFKDKKHVIGLILALDIFEEPMNSKKKKHYIGVSKVTEKTICITKLIEVQSTAEKSYIKAREIADSAIRMPCLPKSK